MTRHLVASLFLLAVVALTITGCGPGNPLGRKAISGKVIFGGEPLANGSISFEPLEAGGVTSGATISNGDYSIAANGGLPAGKYRVRINASKATAEVPKDLPPGTPGPPAVELIPAAYNSKSEEIIEVTDSSTEFNFDIPAK